MTMKIREKGLDTASLRHEVFNTLKDKKFHIFGVIFFIIGWILCFIFYLITIYELIMMIFSVIFVVFFFLMYVIQETKFNMAYEILEKNPDFRKLQNEVEQKKNQKE